MADDGAHFDRLSARKDAPYPPYAASPHRSPLIGAIKPQRILRLPIQLAQVLARLRSFDSTSTSSAQGSGSGNLCSFHLSRQLQCPLD